MDELPVLTSAAVGEDPRDAHRPVAVGVVVNVVGGYSRGVLRGVASYAAGRGWRLGVAGVNVAAVQPEARRWDGILAQIPADAGGERLVAACKEAEVPLVNISSAVAAAGIPSVVSDDGMVGRIGAEHLLRLGIRRLAFFGPDQRAFVELRHRGFMGRCREAGVPADALGDRGGLTAFVRAGGGGVMACNDRAALEVLDVCREVGRRVPEEVAVLGVDDDDLLQSLAYPPLSSVNTARDRVGFEAAAMLDRLMSAGRGGLGMIAGGNEAMRVLVAPKGVVARRSTDTLAIADRDVAEAARFIHANAGRPITVEDVVRAGTVSRRQLERRFRVALGRSMLEEITRCRVDRARQLLAETDLTLEQVAMGSGFASGSYFSVVFKRATGQTPQRFRELQRLVH